MDFPAIDPVKTGDNITRLRKAAGLSVHDVQAAFGFNSPQAIYNGKTERRCLLWIILSVSQRCCASGWMISSSQIVPEFSVGSRYSRFYGPLV